MKQTNLLKNKKVFLSCFVSLLMLIGGNAWGQNLATWSFTGSGVAPLTPSSNADNVTIGSLTAGSGITGNTTGSAWGGSIPISADMAAGLANYAYATFTVKANAGYKVSLDQIGPYNIRRSGTGASIGQWQYSIGNGYVNIGNAITWGAVTTATGNEQDAIPLSSIKDLQDVDDQKTITIRLVIWGTSVTGGNWYFNGSTSATTRTLTINGTATAVTTDPVISSSKTSLNFGEVDTNTTSGAQTFTLNATNIKNDISLAIKDAASAFTLTSPATYTQDGSYTVSVTFSPTGVATYEDVLVISSDDLEDDIEIALSGKGKIPCGIAELPLTIDATNSTTTAVNGTGTDCWVIDVANVAGYWGLQPNKKLISPAIDFSAWNNVRVILNVGCFGGNGNAATTVYVYVVDDIAGTNPVLAGSVTPATNGNVQQAPISVTATGTKHILIKANNATSSIYPRFYVATITADLPTISVDPLSLNFSNIIVGTPTGANEDIIGVTGTNLTNDIDVAITGPDAGLFEADETTIDKAGDVIIITYTPLSQGIHTATLTLTSGKVIKTVPLTGIAMDPPVAGQTSYYWNFGTTAANPSPSPSEVNNNLTVGDITIGNISGTAVTTANFISTTSNSGTSYPGASAQYNAGNEAKNGALDTGNNGSAYFEFSVTPASGYVFNLLDISFGTRSTATGPAAYSLRSSLDNYATEIAGGTITVSGTPWALKLNSNLTFESTNSPVTFRLYGYGGSGTVNSVNWRIDDLSIALVATTKFVIGPTQTKIISDYKGGDIIFQSNDTHTGQLDLEGATSFAVPAGAVVKLEKTVVANRWYAIGFPFNVDQVYLNETYPVLDAYHPSTGGHFWLKTINPDETAKFEYVQTIVKDRGYIFQVPQALVDVNEVVTFISGENATLYNIEELDVNEMELEIEKFGMIVNPSVADITLPCVEGENHTNHFYVFDEDKNFTHHHGREKTLKPFESLVVFTNPNGQSVPLSINIETGPTGLFKISADKGKIVDVRYYNLQGLEVKQPVENNIYIVKTTYESNAVETTKVIK